MIIIIVQQLAVERNGPGAGALECINRIVYIYIYIYIHITICIYVYIYIYTYIIIYREREIGNKLTSRRRFCFLVPCAAVAVRPNAPYTYQRGLGSHLLYPYRCPGQRWIRRKDAYKHTSIAMPP